MRGNKVQQRKGGKGMAVLAFFIGILFGIILLLGAVGGGIYYVLTADLDNVLGWFGVDNSADEDGDNKYINTDTDKGGVSNILELVTAIVDMAGNFQTLTLGEIDALVPATHGLVDQLLDSLSKYVEVDYDTLSNTQFSKLGDYIKEVVMDIRPYALLEAANLNGDGAANQLLDLLLCGAEAKYVEVDGSEIPLYYDTFTAENGSAYKRVDDGKTLARGLDGYTVEKKKKDADSGEYTYTYRVYHYEIIGSDGETDSFVAQKTDEGFEATGISYIANDNEPLYSEDYAKCSGNYFVDAEGERVYIDPITIGSFVDGDGMGALEDAPLSDLLGTMVSDDEDNQKLISAILGGITVGDLMNGEADFYDAIQSIHIGDIIEANGNKILETLGKYTMGELSTAMDEITIGDLMEIPASEPIMVYLAYGITSVKEENGVYTATYKEIVDDEELSTTVYLDIEQREEKGKTVAYILGVYRDAEFTESLPGTTLNGENGINSRVSGFMADVPIKDLLSGSSDQMILDAIGDMTINDLTEGGFNSIEIGILVGNIPADNAILAYLAYGITGVEEENGAYTATYKWKEEGVLHEDTVYLTTEVNVEDGKTYITGVYTDRTVQNDDTRLTGTTIGGINNIMNGFMEDVTIADLLGNGADDRIIGAIGHLTINDLANGEGLDSIEIAILLDVPADNAILAYLGYGVYGVEEDETDGYIAYIKVEENGETVEKKVYLTTKINDNGDKLITGVYLDEDCTDAVEGTKIGEINTRLGGITGSLKIKDIIGGDPDSKILQAIGDFTIDQLSDEDTLNQIEITALLDIPANNAILAYLGYRITGVTINKTDDTKGTAMLGDEEVNLKLKKETADNGEVTYYIQSVVHENGNEVKGTGFGQLSERIDGLMTEVPIKDLINIPADNAIIQKIGECTLSTVADTIDDFEVAELIYIDPTADNNAILLYLAFGVTKVNYDQTLHLYTAQIDGETVYFKTRTGESGVAYLDSIYSDTALTERVPAVKLIEVGDKLTGLQENIKVGDIVDLEGNSPIIALLNDCYLSEVGNLISDLTLPQVVNIPVNNKILAYLGYGITELEYTEGDETGTAMRGDEQVTLVIKAVDRNGTTTYYIDSVLDENGNPVDGTNINDVSGKIDELTATLKIKDIIEIDPADKLMTKIGEYTIENVSDAVNDLTVTDVMDINAESALMAYLAYGITGIELDKDGLEGTALLDGETVYLELSATELDDSGKVTYYIERVTKDDGTEVESVSINAIGSRIDGIADNLTIGDLIEVGDDKLMNKLANCKIGEVSGAIQTLELADVMDIDSNSTIMAYLGYGLTNIDVQNGTATWHYTTANGEKAERSVQLTVDNRGIITEVYYMEGGEKVPVEGTKINEVSSRIDGLMSDLTVGELMGIGDSGSTILKAIKNSTINTLAEDINNLSINRLYADSIYKDPVIKEVVEENASEGQIVYDPVYLYYELVDGDYQLVDGTGKVEVFESGLYTYGEVGGFWKLLIMERLDDGSKTEYTYTLNDMPAMASNLSDNLRYCTLYELEDAEILDFSDKDVNPLNSRIPNIEIIAYHNEKIGDLTISQAIEAIASLMDYIDRLPSLGA